jgi:hypothetical protein
MAAKKRNPNTMTVAQWDSLMSRWKKRTTKNPKEWNDLMVQWGKRVRRDIKNIENYLGSISGSGKTLKKKFKTKP